MKIVFLGESIRVIVKYTIGKGRCGYGMSSELFAFVILQYCAMQETLDCIESIKKYCDDSYVIIVVDNGSPNNAGEKIKGIIGNDDKCLVLLNEENLGFAKGNNIGFRYAKKLGARFICIMNSDTCLVDEFFVEQAKSDYFKYKYYVLGPNIVLKQPEVRVNPLGEHVLERAEVKKKIISLIIQIVLVSLKLENIISTIQNRKRLYAQKQEYNRRNYYFNVKLHGCCLIFSPEYIKEYNGLNEGTFLYLEEEMLFLEMQRANHIMLYSPKVTIYHAEDASTNFITSGRKKRVFVLKNHLKSMLAIEKRIKELEKEEKYLKNLKKDE